MNLPPATPISSFFPPRIKLRRILSTGVNKTKLTVNLYYHVLGTMLDTYNILSHVIFTLVSWDSCYCSFPYTVGEIETQRLTTCWRFWVWKGKIQDSSWGLRTETTFFNHDPHTASIRVSFHPATSVLPDGEYGWYGELISNASATTLYYFRISQTRLLQEQVFMPSFSRCMEWSWYVSKTSLGSSWTLGVTDTWGPGSGMLSDGWMFWC